MGVKITIPPSHYRFTDGKRAVHVKGNTVGQCFDVLVGRFPEMSQALFGEDGELLHYVNIYVNGKSAYPNELKRTVREGDELEIALIIGGG